ncbi:class I SAM-dependent methyltransferase [Tateyamaria sp. SN3-11]|uniref:class I SAM-dependent methyltransferase n=1 Tax=Tateyamaria sp. SN3-11 TaxID=3092147 RepID=UPI0039E8EF67
MTPEERDAFFTVHRDLPREGPGEVADVAWVIAQTGISGAVDVFDAACGPGADLETLADSLPEARLLGVEQVSHFVEAAAARVARFGPRVRVELADMAAPEGRYDLIWCAGALYFLGIAEGLRGWRDALKPGGKVAFSEPVLLETPASDAVTAFWEEYPQITDLDGIKAQVADAGYRTLGHRMIVGTPWRDYYDPMQARIDALRKTHPDAALSAALDENQQEIDRWKAAQDQIAYALLIVEPA